MNTRPGDIRKVAMQPVSVNIDVKSSDIPALVCSDHSEHSTDSEYVGAIAKAVAETLGIEEFLSEPERIDELRRRLWELAPGF